MSFKDFLKESEDEQFQDNIDAIVSLIYSLEDESLLDFIDFLNHFIDEIPELTDYVDENTKEEIIDTLDDLSNDDLEYILSMFEVEVEEDGEMNEVKHRSPSERAVASRCAAKGLKLVRKDGKIVKCSKQKDSEKKAKAKFMANNQCEEGFAPQKFGKKKYKCKKIDKTKSVRAKKAQARARR